MKNHRKEKNETRSRMEKKKKIEHENRTTVDSKNIEGALNILYLIFNM